MIPLATAQPTGTFTYNLRFPGQYYDMESGLNYNLNRDYAPALGRYVESDPIGLAGGINTYGYVGQNPLWAVDALGLMDMILYPSSDSLAQRASKVPSENGSFSLAAHGDAQHIGDPNNNLLDAAQLAELIRGHSKYKNGMPVDLYACNTGSDSNGIAQQLANILQAPVRAPDNYMWIFDNGGFLVAPAQQVNLKNGPDLGHQGGRPIFYPSSK